MTYSIATALSADLIEASMRETLRRAVVDAKPRIRPVGHTPGWWECNGEGRRSIGRSPQAAYRSWRAAAQWGGA